jgi:hypothetical protein
MRISSFSLSLNTDAPRTLDLPKRSVLSPDIKRQLCGQIFPPESFLQHSQTFDLIPDPGHD